MEEHSEELTTDELMIFNVFYSKKMWRRLYLPRSAKTCNRLIQDDAAVNFQQILRRTSYSCRCHTKLFFSIFFHFFYCRFLRNCLKDEISLFRPINTSLKIFINIWYIPFNKSWFCNILMCTFATWNVLLYFALIYMGIMDLLNERFV